MNEKTYYNNGKLKSEFKKNNNEQFDGLYKEYYETGKIKIEYSYKNGKLDGVSREYYKNNQLSCEYNFKNGQLNGICKEYYETGKIKEEYICRDGQFDGLYIKYYTNGHIKSEYNYRNGRLDGISKEYRINGDIELEYNYKKINLEKMYEKYEDKNSTLNIMNNTNEILKTSKVKIDVPENIKNIVVSEKLLKGNNTSKSFQEKSNKLFYIIIPIILFLSLGIFSLYKLKDKNNEYQKQNSIENTNSYSQLQQGEIKKTVVKSHNINEHIPTAKDTRYINYKTYYNDNYGYSVDYPDNNYFQISKTYEDGIRVQNDNGDIIISLTSNWNPNSESLQQAYDRAVKENPNAPYKFLGKTFFTITYEENGAIIFRKTVYDMVNDKYIYLYVNFPPEYKDYMTPIVERIANSMKKYNPTISSTNDNNIYAESEVERKFGRVIRNKYVGGSFIEFLRDANQNEYYYLREQFWEILDTMYITEDNKTYYYLNDIINQLEKKADWDHDITTVFLEVKGNKLYYTVGFPKGYNANTPSWIQFEIFERKFKDGIELHTAHISCAINGVEYKDWQAIDAIYK